MEVHQADVTWIESVPDVLTAQQVAQVIGCSDEHIYNLWRRKMLPHFKVGRLVRMSKAQLFEWIEQQGGVTKEEAGDASQRTA